MVARKRIITWGAVALLFVVTSAESCDTSTDKDIPDASGENESAAADAPKREARNADGKFRSSCDMLLPEDFLSGDYSFVGVAKASNMGNVGIVVRVRATWDQIASANVRAEKTVRLKPGQRRSVKFRESVTQTQVDEFQNSPDYFEGKACRVKATIVDDFGKAPFEG